MLCLFRKSGASKSSLFTFDQNLLPRFQYVCCSLGKFKVARNRMCAFDTWATRTMNTKIAINPRVPYNTLLERLSGNCCKLFWETYLVISLSHRFTPDRPSVYGSMALASGENCSVFVDAGDEVFVGGIDMMTFKI